tara:strand:+ start:857 stop:2374 length:1518 start_codon:yes stop_codon:yes gene_type:complete
VVSRGKSTATSVFGSSRRESHDSTAFYSRFTPPFVSRDETVNLATDLGDGCLLGDSRDMHQIPDSSVALIVTSPPYFVGKEYEIAVTAENATGIPESYLEYLEMLHDVFAECVRVLEPGGRIAVNVANLGRRPYRSLSSDIIRILQDELGLLLRGEVVWQKAEGATGSVAWGSFRSASNPVLRDVTERVVVASKGRFDRARNVKQRLKEDLPHENTVTTDEFMEATLDLWRIDAEQANRVGHPAPFPVELPRRLIDLYSFKDDLVLDPFMGSGSTLVAALRAGRRGVGYDIDSGYIDLARERLELEKKRLSESQNYWKRRDLSGSLIEQNNLFDETAARDESLSKATESGKKASDIAQEHLLDAGFEIVKTKVNRRDLGVNFPFLVTDQKEGRQWYVEVSGSFTSTRAGMRRPDVLWKTIGRAHVLTSSDDESGKNQLIVLTPQIPKHKSEGDRALKAVCGSGLFDVIEMFNPDAQKRLEFYAHTSPDRPLPGFWTEEEIDKNFT